MLSKIVHPHFHLELLDNCRNLVPFLHVQVMVFCILLIHANLPAQKNKFEQITRAKRWMSYQGTCSSHSTARYKVVDIRFIYENIQIVHGQDLHTPQTCSLNHLVYIGIHKIKEIIQSEIYLINYFQSFLSGIKIYPSDLKRRIPTDLDMASICHWKVIDP